MNLTALATKNIKAVVFVALVLCLGGLSLYSTFPVSILPDVSFPRVVVIAEVGDTPVRQVEVAVARPIEEAIATIPNVKKVRSKSERGSTEINVDFNWGTDILVAEQLVNAKVNQVRPQLPLETSTEVERMNPTVFPVLGLSLNSKSLTQSELWNLATYTLKPRLSRVDGVARVVVQGGRVPELSVEVDPLAIKTLGLSLNDITQSLAQSNQIHSLGQINQSFQRFQILLNGQSYSASDIGEITIAQRKGVPILLRQVAKVSTSVEDVQTVVGANGQESVLLNIVRQPSANSVAMAAAVQSELSSIKATLPHGVEVNTFYDQSILIRDAVQSVQEAVLIGAVLAVVVLMLFLGDLRATLTTAAIIPMTVLITFLFMRAAGLTLNLMTLGALAVGIGLVIDDAIVVVENVFKHLKSDGVSVREAVALASKEIAAPMVSSTLTTVVVFLPLILLQGVAGAFFSALAITLTIALLVSLALALVVSPSLCAAFLKVRAGAHDHGRLFQRFLDGYGKLLSWCLNHKWIALAVAGASLATIFFVAPKLESGFMPEMDEGSFVLDYTTPPGSSLEESNRLLKKVDELLSKTPEVVSYSRRTGTELGFAITEVNRGDYSVMLKQGYRRPIAEVMDDLRGQIAAEIPGLDVEFIQVLQDLIGDLAGNPSPIEVKLFGEDQEQLTTAGEDLIAALSKKKGIVDLTSSAMEGSPETTVTLDPARVGRLGLSAESVSEQATAAIFGTVATQVLQGDRQVGVRVRFPKSYRTDTDRAMLVPIHSPNGFEVPLGSLGTVESKAGSSQTQREDQRRMVSITARLEGIDLGTGVKDVEKVLHDMPFHAGITTVVAGQAQSQQESFSNLVTVLGVAVLLVFVVMLFQFGSFTAPVTILLLMPLSFAGAVLALFGTHTALNVSSFMGAIMLAGIVVKNGILLLDRAQGLESGGKTVSEAVMQAGQERLRPILMTTLTAILGLVPLALGLGAGAEMQKPLAVAVIGGLTFSTVLTLVVGPVVYSAFRGLRRR